MSGNDSDGAYPTGATTVDSVTEQLATRLGVVGESAGELLRRKVRGAAGGAETIALLVGSDAEGAQRIGAASGDLHATTDRLAGTAGTAAPPAPGDPASSAPTPPPEVTHGDAADRPAAAWGSDDPAPPGPAPAPSESVATPPPGPVETPHASAPGSDAAPGAPASQPGPPAAAPPGPESVAAPPGPDPVAAPVPAPGSGDAAAAPGPPAAPHPDLSDSRTADPAAGPVPAAGQTPWTAGQTPAGADPGTGQPSGSTPWNSGAGSSGSSTPYLPGMPGGLGSLTPQERPPRGGAPWSRGRTERNPEGTVFPRPRPEERAGRPD